MLSAPSRLKLDRDFKRVWKCGLFFGLPNLRLKLAKNNLNHSRFGFIVSLKVDKRSTVRNKLKRQVREVVRLLIKNGQIKPKFDVVFTLSAGLKNRKYPEIEKDVRSLLQKAHLLSL